MYFHFSMLFHQTIPIGNSARDIFSLGLLIILFIQAISRKRILKLVDLVCGVLYYFHIGLIIVIKQRFKNKRSFLILLADQAFK